MSAENPELCQHDYIVIAWQYIYRADKEDEASSWSDDPEERRRKLAKTYKKIIIGKQARKVWCKRCDEVQYLNLPHDI